jgi:peroxiredoxin
VEIRAQGGEVVAISTGSTESAKEVADAYRLDYPLLSDPDLAAIDAFGVRHVGGGIDGDIARPAVFVVDREGRIAWRELAENWRVRLRPETLVARLAEVP